MKGMCIRSKWQGLGYMDDHGADKVELYFTQAVSKFGIY